MTNQDLVEDVIEAPAELVRAPTVPPFRPLQRRASSIVPRDGSFDYRNSPSLMGGQRVPYRTQI
jgi:hypothetical protein